MAVLSDLNIFKKWCLHYQKKLGLLQWELVFNSLGIDGKNAEIWYDWEGKVATVNLSNKKGRTRSIRDLAKHEMIHLLLADLFVMGEDRTYTKSHAEAAEEGIVRTLEKLI